MTLLATKLSLTRTLGELARRSGRGGGTSLPGKLLLRLEPAALELLSARLANGSAVISATNGKTTTAAMAAAILEASGRRLVRNSTGANMAGGIATTLANAARGGGIDGELGLFEVDELWLARLVTALRPRALLLCNLFRDQLDRFGELELIAQRWAQMLSEEPGDSSHAARRPAGGSNSFTPRERNRPAADRSRARRPRLVLNADDPLIADLGDGRANVTYFGIDDPAVGRTELSHASDSKHCRRCGTPYRYEVVYLGHLGCYRCPACGHARPQPSVRAAGVELHGARSTTFTLLAPQGSRQIRLALPGLYNVYNAVGAAALCLSLGATLEQVASGLAATRPAFGRGQQVLAGGVALELLLIKNPAGANEIARTLTLEPGPLDLLVALNDRTADGRDVSWVWDADFEPLAEKLRTLTCTGTRAAEIAVRFKYAGVQSSRIRVVPELGAALDAALRAASGTGGSTHPTASGLAGHAPAARLFVLPTYTAMLELQRELAARGHVAHYWEQAA